MSRRELSPEKEGTPWEVLGAILFIVVLFGGGVWAGFEMADGLNDPVIPTE